MSVPSYIEAESERERRAREAVQKLEFWCDEYPELARHIENRIDVIITDAKSTPHSDRDMVLGALETGAATVREIVEDVEEMLTLQRVHHALRELVRVELVRKYKPEGSREIHFFLTRKSPFEAMPESIQPGRRPYKPRGVRRS